MKDADLRAMSRADLEDEVMLLRAQVKVLQNDRAGLAMDLQYALDNCEGLRDSLYNYQES